MVAPHCAETPAAHDDGDDPSSDNLKWRGVSVIIDDDTHELFKLSKRNDDPEQKPALLVTQSTANLVRQDFERYEPSLERMAKEWQENKKSLSIQKTKDTILGFLGIFRPILTGLRHFRVFTFATWIEDAVVRFISVFGAVVTSLCDLL